MSRVPPVTKYLLCTLVICSLVVWFLRYYEYIVAINNYNYKLSEGERQRQSITDDDIRNGKNFPQDPKMRIPSINDYYVPYLVIVAQGYGSLLFPWVFILASFVEEHILSLLLTSTTFWYGSKYCEQIWGGKELIRFLLVVALVPNVIVYIGALLFVDRTVPDDGGIILPAIVNGGAAILVGHLVAFKQIVPEHLIVLFKGSIKFRVKRLVLLFLLMSSFVGIFGAHIYCSLAWAGFFTSWTYLRFFRVTYADPVLPFNKTSKAVAFEHFNSSSGIKIRGDAADSFAMSGFFPEPFNMLIDWVVNLGAKPLGTLGIKSPFSHGQTEAANARAAARNSSLGGGAGFISLSRNSSSPNAAMQSPFVSKLSRRDEAERRRSLALRALDHHQSELRPPNPAVLPAPKAGKD